MINWTHVLVFLFVFYKNKEHNYFLNIKNNKYLLNTNRKISEESCDNEDYSNDAKTHKKNCNDILQCNVHIIKWWV